MATPARLARPASAPPGIVPMSAGSLFRRIVESRRVEVDAACLERIAGATIDALSDQLGQLVRAGLIEYWDRPGLEPVIVLTALAAAQAKLRVSPGGQAWLRPGELPRRDVRGRGAAALESELSGPEGEFTLDAIPERPRRPGAPRVLLGESVQWHGPDAQAWPSAADGACPGCRGRELPPDWYCLICDRAGRELIAAAARPAASVPREPRRSRLASAPRLTRRARAA